MTPSRPKDARERVLALRSPVAVTRRLELTLPERRRLAEMVAAINDPDVARWTLRIPYPYRRSDGEATFRRWAQKPRTGAALPLHIVRRADDALVGGLGVHDVDPEHLRGEIGYWLGPAFRGHGYAREAVRALCRLAHGTIGLNRLEAGVFPGNSASVAVLLANGFRREGRLRENVRKDGRPTDVLLYSRLRDDPWPPLGGPGRKRAGSVAPAR